MNLYELLIILKLIYINGFVSDAGILQERYFYITFYYMLFGSSILIKDVFGWQGWSEMGKKFNLKYLFGHSYIVFRFWSTLQNIKSKISVISVCLFMIMQIDVAPRFKDSSRPIFCKYLQQFLNGIPRIKGYPLDACLTLLH